VKAIGVTTATPTRSWQDGPLGLLGVYVVFLGLVLVYTWPLVRDPGALLRRYYDVHYWVWMLGWVARRLVEAPSALFDAPIFYPYGLTLAFSEPMLVPALVSVPIQAVIRNPILAYSVTVLLFQALAGWAAYLTASRLTGSRPAGWVAGIVFALSPLATGHYQFAHMQLTFATPLAFLGWARFLERERIGDLAVGLGFLWCQMVSVMYFGVPLCLMLAGLTLGFVLLRPRPWRRRTLVALAVGALAFMLAFLPIAWPYLVARSEMGFERGLADTDHPGRTADILTYVDAGRLSRFYRLVDSGAQPGLFPGFTVVALVLLAFVASPRPVGLGLPRPGVWGFRLVRIGLASTAGAIALFLLTGGWHVTLAGFTVRMTEVGRAVGLLLGLGAAWLALHGWAWLRTGGPRPLAPREWAGLLGWLVVIFIVLSLGPVMRLGGQPVGVGLFALVHKVFLPIRAIRVTLRIGFAAMFLLGLLAAYGLATLRARLPSPRAARVLWLVPVVLLVEYLPVPLAYEVVRWSEARPVYAWLARQPGDFPILEWPSFYEFPDATYTMWTLFHGKRLVNAASGFDPPFTDAMRTAVGALPDPEAVARLRSIYPLGYLLGHLDQLGDGERRRWEGFQRTPPDGLRVVGRFGDTLVLEPAGPEQSHRWERTFSTELVSRRPHARVRVGLARVDPDIEPVIDATFNGRALGRLTPGPTATDVGLPLAPPYPRVDRNRLVLQLGYRLRPGVAAGPRYAIGTTGVTAPVDVVVRSAGRDHGRSASIVVNGVDVAPDLRGYNVVLIDPQSGVVQAREVFDTFIARAESARLADFIRRAPAGAIVVAAVKDDGAGQLGDDGVAALRALGSRVDPRDGGLFVSHVVIGVKGARPGTAVEALAAADLTRVVGRDRADVALLIEDFQLE
jgi:hypothetical protein